MADHSNLSASSPNPDASVERSSLSFINNVQTAVAEIEQRLAKSPSNSTSTLPIDPPTLPPSASSSTAALATVFSDPIASPNLLDAHISAPSISTVTEKVEFFERSSPSTMHTKNTSDLPPKPSQAKTIASSSSSNHPSYFEDDPSNSNSELETNKLDIVSGHNPNLHTISTNESSSACISDVVEKFESTSSEIDRTTTAQINVEGKPIAPTVEHFERSVAFASVKPGTIDVHMAPSLSTVDHLEAPSSLPLYSTPSTVDAETKAIQMRKDQFENPLVEDTHTEAKPSSIESKSIQPTVDQFESQLDFIALKSGETATTIENKSSMDHSGKDANVETVPEPPLSSALHFVASEDEALRKIQDSVFDGSGKSNQVQDSSKSELNSENQLCAQSGGSPHIASKENLSVDVKEFARDVTDGNDGDMIEDDVVQTSSTGTQIATSETQDQPVHTSSQHVDDEDRDSQADDENLEPLETMKALDADQSLSKDPFHDATVELRDQRPEEPKIGSLLGSANEESLVNQSALRLFEARKSEPLIAEQGGDGTAKQSQFDLNPDDSVPIGTESPVVSKEAKETIEKDQIATVVHDSKQTASTETPSVIIKDNSLQLGAQSNPRNEVSVQDILKEGSHAVEELAPEEPDNDALSTQDTSGNASKGASVKSDTAQISGFSAVSGNEDEAPEDNEEMVRTPEALSVSMGTTEIVVDGAHCGLLDNDGEIVDTNKGIEDSEQEHAREESKVEQLETDDIIDDPRSCDVKHAELMGDANTPALSASASREPEDDTSFNVDTGVGAEAVRQYNDPPTEPEHTGLRSNDPLDKNLESSMESPPSQQEEPQTGSSSEGNTLVMAIPSAVEPTAGTHNQAHVSDAALCALRSSELEVTGACVEDTIKRQSEAVGQASTCEPFLNNFQAPEHARKEVQEKGEIQPASQQLEESTLETHMANESGGSHEHTPEATHMLSPEGTEAGASDNTQGDTIAWPENQENTAATKKSSQTRISDECQTLPARGSSKQYPMKSDSVDQVVSAEHMELTREENNGDGDSNAISSSFSPEKITVPAGSSPLEVAPTIIDEIMDPKNSSRGDAKMMHPPEIGMGRGQDQSMVNSFSSQKKPADTVFADVLANLGEDLKAFEAEIEDFDESDIPMTNSEMDRSLSDEGISQEEARLLAALKAELHRAESSGVAESPNLSGDFGTRDELKADLTAHHQMSFHPKEQSKEHLEFESTRAPLLEAGQHQEQEDVTQVSTIFTRVSTELSTLDVTPGTSPPTSDNQTSSITTVKHKSVLTTKVSKVEEEERLDTAAPGEVMVEESFDSSSVSKRRNAPLLKSTVNAKESAEDRRSDVNLQNVTPVRQSDGKLSLGAVPTGTRTTFLREIRRGRVRHRDITSTIAFAQRTLSNSPQRRGSSRSRSRESGIRSRYTDKKSPEPVGASSPNMSSKRAGSEEQMQEAPQKDIVLASKSLHKSLSSISGSPNQSKGLKNARDVNSKEAEENSSNDTPPARHESSTVSSEMQSSGEPLKPETSENETMRTPNLGQPITNLQTVTPSQKASTMGKSKVMETPKQSSGSSQYIKTKNEGLSDRKQFEATRPSQISPGSPRSSRVSRQFIRPMSKSTNEARGVVESVKSSRHQVTSSFVKRSSVSMTPKTQRRSPFNSSSGHGDRAEPSPLGMIHSPGQGSQVRRASSMSQQSSRSSSVDTTRSAPGEKSTGRLPRVATLTGRRSVQPRSPRTRLARGSTIASIPRPRAQLTPSRLTRGLTESASDVQEPPVRPGSPLSASSTPAQQTRRSSIFRRTLSFSQNRRASASTVSKIPTNPSAGLRSPGSDGKHQGRIIESSGTPLRGLDRRSTISMNFGSAPRPLRISPHKPTVPEPFDLAGLELHERTQLQIEEARRQAHENERRRRSFKPRPMPDFSNPWPSPKPRK